jgi:hypothetical protein
MFSKNTGSKTVVLQGCESEVMRVSGCSKFESVGVLGFVQEQP